MISSSLNNWDITGILILMIVTCGKPILALDMATNIWEMDPASSLPLLLTNAILPSLVQNIYSSVGLPLDQLELEKPKQQKIWPRL